MKRVPLLLGMILLFVMTLLTACADDLPCGSGEPCGLVCAYSLPTPSPSPQVLAVIKDGCLVDRAYCSDPENQLFDSVQPTKLVLVQLHPCYSGATCERQESGSCGWTVTSEIRACLEAPIQRFNYPDQVCETRNR